MKISKSDQVEQIRESMRGGDGCAVLHHILTDKNRPAKCRLFSRITLLPGCSIGEHVHENEAEIFYILSGRAQMTDSFKTLKLEAGDSCMTANASHSIRCVGEDPLEILAVIIKD